MVKSLFSVLHIVANAGLFCKMKLSEMQEIIHTPLRPQPVIRICREDSQSSHTRTFERRKGGWKIPLPGRNNENFTLVAVRFSPHQSLSRILSGRKPHCGNGRLSGVVTETTINYPASALPLPFPSDNATFPMANCPGTGFPPGSGAGGCSAFRRLRTSAAPGGCGLHGW